MEHPVALRLYLLRMLVVEAAGRELEVSYPNGWIAMCFRFDIYSRTSHGSSVYRGNSKGIARQLHVRQSWVSVLGLGLGYSPRGSKSVQESRVLRKCLNGESCIDLVFCSRAYI